MAERQKMVTLLFSWDQLWQGFSGGGSTQCHPEMITGNGQIAPIQPVQQYACLVDCLHIEDLAQILKEKGLDVRPAGK